MKNLEDVPADLREGLERVGGAVGRDEAIHALADLVLVIAVESGVKLNPEAETLLVRIGALPFKEEV